MSLTALTLNVLAKNVDYFVGQCTMQVSEEEAMDSVFGYTVANDLSARDWQMKRYILVRMIHPCLSDSSLPA